MNGNTQVYLGWYHSDEKRGFMLVKAKSGKHCKRMFEYILIKRQKHEMLIDMETEEDFQIL